MLCKCLILNNYCHHTFDIHTSILTDHTGIFSKTNKKPDMGRCDNKFIALSWLVIFLWGGHGGGGGVVEVGAGQQEWVKTVLIINI